MRVNIQAGVSSLQSNAVDNSAISQPSNLTVNISGESPSIKASTNSADGSSGTSSSSASGGGGASSSGLSAAAQTTLKLIAQLEKQLAQEQAALKSALEQSKGNDVSSMTRVDSAESAVETTMGQLQVAISKLAEEMTASGAASTGALLNTST